MKLNNFPDKKQFEALAGKHNVVPLCAEILADTETPVSLLRKFYANSGPIFLLESVEGGERWGRYSFLGTSARSHIRVFKTHVEISTAVETKRIPHDRDPLKVLKELSAGFNPAKVPGLPRFWGGLVGYLTYEMVSFFEKIPHKLPDEKPLAHFIIPDELIIFDNIRNTMTAVVITFIEEQKEIAAAYRTASSRIECMTAKMSRPMPPEKEPGAAGSGAPLAKIAPETFMDKVKKVKNHIQSGDVIQTVISQPFSCRAPEDLWMLYRAQRYINPSPYLFFMHLGDTALVGSSPETMVRLENQVATLRPIAGTRPRGNTEKEDRLLADELLADEKERAEHLMLVDLGRNDLGRVARTGTVQVTDLMFVERYSHVMHLVSNITCDLKPEMDAWDLIRSTFPAGTLSGAPKVRAMEIIADLENAPRGPYGGAVGYISFGGNMDLAITIRTACVESGQLTIRSGAGIVADSDPEKEHQETVNKARAIQKALEMIN